MSLSHHACQSLDLLMQDGMQQSLPAPGHSMSITSVDHVPNGTATHVAVLSIASFSFRIGTALHFSYQGSTRDWIASIRGVAPEQLERQQLQDSICELGNLCGGAINRELGQFQRFLGLSTPQILHGRSMPFLPHGAPEHVRHFKAEVSSQHCLYATLWARAFMPVDFTWIPAHRETSIDAGELELF